MGMQAVKLFSNEVLHFLTGVPANNRLTCIMAVKWLYVA